MRAARTPAGTNVCHRWLLAILNLDRNGVFLCSLSTADVRLLLTGRDVGVQTGHSELAVKDEK